MLHPSYADLIEVLNSDVEEGEQPVVNSRYSVVLATAKRAREISSDAQENGESAVITSTEKPSELIESDFLITKSANRNTRVIIPARITENEKPVSIIKKRTPSAAIILRIFHRMSALMLYIRRL